MLQLFETGLQDCLLLQVFLILSVIISELSEDQAFLSASVHHIIDLRAEAHESVQLVALLVLNAQVLQTLWHDSWDLTLLHKGLILLSE